MTFGEYLREKREGRGYTQNKLALASGLNSATISRLEAGKVVPETATLVKLAKALRLPAEGLAQAAGLAMPEESPKKKGVQIPVLGEIAAGIPLDAIEEVIDYEEIPASMAKTGDFLGLRIKGDSMSPHILDGDTVIIRQQADIESGEIAAVLINGDAATCKKVVKQEGGILLIAYNAAVYQPHFYSNAEVKRLPITIIGKVVELRRKF